MSEEKKARYTDAHKKATMKWEKANRFRITAKFPIEMQEAILDRAKVFGSVNAYIKALVEADLSGDESETVRETFYEAP